MVLDQYMYKGIHRLHDTFILYANIPWDQTNQLYSGQVSCYVLIRYEKEI